MAEECSISENSPRKDLLGLTRPQLIDLTSLWGFSRIHAVTLWNELYQRGHRAFTVRDRLPTRFLQRVADELDFTFPSVARETHSSDGFTRKYLLGLGDGHQIETVLMRYRGRTTACVSSQVGCAMGCVFCATGQMGYTRHLTTAEIEAQALHVESVLRETTPDPSTPHLSAPALCRPEHPSVYHRHERLRNLVFMGMGEPMANFNAVVGTIHRIHDDSPEGLGISARNITVSTVGIVPRINDLAALGLPVRLAVSLHAPTDELRNTLVPLNERYPIKEVLDASWKYAETSGRRVSIEYAMIKSMNDQVIHAKQLANLLRGKDVHVNLIPLNPTPGSKWTASDPKDEKIFLEILEQSDIAVTVRDTRGREIDGACGQLAASEV